MTVPIQYLQKSSRQTEKIAYSSTGKAPRLWTLNPVLQLHFPHFQCARASFADGIRLNERQFEELISNRSNSDISGGINDDLAPENESDSDEEVTEQIGRCNLPGRSRSNRIVKTPARLHDYF